MLTSFIALMPKPLLTKAYIKLQIYTVPKLISNRIGYSHGSCCPGLAQLSLLLSCYASPLKVKFESILL